MYALSNHETLRQRAKRRLPRVVFDFVDGGAEDEITLRRNRTAFEDLCLVPRILRGAANASAEVELFGQRLRLPVLLAPAGNARMAGPEGELAQARGASAAGTICVLSSTASVPAEEIAQSVPQPQWFQLYLYRERALTLEVVERAKRLGFAALVLTADAPVAGHRERDARNGLRIPLRITPPMLPAALLRPRWMRYYWTSGPMAPHVEPDSPNRAAGRSDQVDSHGDYVAALLNPKQSWEDVKWLRSVWDGKLLVKGVMCGEDAQLALAAGCDGVIVSNHGGRQLDGIPATIEMLSEVVAEVDGRAEVLIDGGIRRGTDVVKALSLGATACLVGRPWWYALATGGAAGVRRVLDELHAEIVGTLQLLGASNLSELTTDLVRQRPGTGWLPVEHAAITSYRGDSR